MALRRYATLPVSRVLHICAHATLLVNSPRADTKTVFVIILFTLTVRTLSYCVA